MKCFAIMPYDRSFGDVLALIKSCAAGVVDITVHRLDDVKPAGQITERLVRELKECSFCVADITGLNANVMWEVGFAMALGKSVILITQDDETKPPPFDIRVHQAHYYARSELDATLRVPLQEAFRATAQSCMALKNDEGRVTPDADHAREVSALGDQLAELKRMVAQLVSAQSEPEATRDRRPLLDEALRWLEGIWEIRAENAWVYVKAAPDQLIAPCNYGGEYDLTGHFHDWRMIGDYYFARFDRFGHSVSGFVFLKKVNDDLLEGASWLDEDADMRGKSRPAPVEPPSTMGVPSLWVRS